MPNRSTTSSTTGRKRSSGSKTRAAITENAPKPESDVDQGELSSEESAESSADAVPSPQLLPAASLAKRLSAVQQEMYLHVLTRGASPAGACAQAGISVLDVLATIEQDDAFRERLDQVNVLLSQNVAAALYRSAMEGSVSAQTFFLKNQPPPNWHDDDPSSAETDPLDKLTDDELLAFCRASGIDWPTETATGTDPPLVED